MKKVILLLMTAFSCCGFLSAQEAHDWTVNVNDYMFNQPLVAFVQIDGEYVTTTGYEVGAFVDGNLRGAAEMAAYSGDSHPIVEMPVYYTAANDQNITFKLYDKATEQVLECETTIALGAAHVELYSDETQAVVLNFITPHPSYTVTMAQDTPDATLWTAKAGTDGTYQQLPLEGVAQGTQVSLKYAGTKKVKSVKAKKKAATP